jgi:hypothetical protein
LFRAQLQDLNFAPGEESLEVALFSENEIPWEEMAFPTVTESLKLFFANRRENNYPLRMLDIVRYHEPRPRLEITLVS